MSLSVGPLCGADWTSDYWGGCHAPSRFRVERPGEGYEPAEACPAHLADMIAFLVDGDDVEVTVQVRFDAPEARDPEREGATEALVASVKRHLNSFEPPLIGSEANLELALAEFERVSGE